MNDILKMRSDAVQCGVIWYNAVKAAQCRRIDALTMLYNAVECCEIHGAMLCHAIQRKTGDIAISLQCGKMRRNLVLKDERYARR